MKIIELESLLEDWSLVVFKQRYGGAYCALLFEDTDIISDAVDSYEGTEARRRHIGDFFDGNPIYPASTGKSYQDAIINLKEKLKKLQSLSYRDWRNVLSEIIGDFKDESTHHEYLTLSSETQKNIAILQASIKK